jgi:taurine--2-oxoglutarate transaminase
VVRAEFERLKAKHPSVHVGRCIGLFGIIDIRKNSNDDPIARYDQSHPAMNELAAFFRKQGLFTFVRWNSFMCNPPLCITEEQLLEGFEIIDRGLAITDAVFEG